MRTQYSTVRHDHTWTLGQTVSGPVSLTAKLSAQRTPVSLAVAQFASAGTPDLITGYATADGGVLLLQRGAPEAVAPGEAEAAILGAGGFVAPFRASAAAIELPVSPDLLLAQDLRGIGHADVLAAARGGNAVYLLIGKGNGTFDTPKALTLRGGITALTTWRSAAGQLLIVAAVQGGQGANGLQFVSSDGTEQAFVPLADTVTTIESARLNQHGIEDLLLTAGGKALVLDGRSVATGTPVIESVPVSGALAATSGIYTVDTRGYNQVAVLAGDGAMHLFTRAGRDTSDQTAEEKALIRAHRTVMPRSLVKRHPAPDGLAWTEVETVSGFGDVRSSAPILLHGRLTVGGFEDLVVLAGGRYMELSHTISAANGVRTSTPELTIDSVSSSPVKAAALSRVSADSRVGVITADSTAHPLVTVPGTHTTYYVNYNIDSYNSTATCASGSGVHCSLRDAVRLANADHGGTSKNLVDVIDVPAGTYTIAITNENVNGGSATNGYADKNYHYDLDTNVNIVGTGSCTPSAAGVATACTTIIDAATKDKIFNGNSTNVNMTSTPLAIFMSSMQLQNGLDSGNNYDTSGGLISMDVDGTGSLTLNTMVLTKSTDVGDAGGAVGGYNAQYNRGAYGNVEIDNSTVSSNASNGPDGPNGAEPGGGGMVSIADATLVVNNVVFSNNLATADDAMGGGLYINVDSSASPTNTLTNVTLTGNSAGLVGGGVVVQNGGTLNNLIVTGNKVVGTSDINASGGGENGGGGIVVDTDFNAFTLSYSTVTGNTLASSAAAGAGLILSGAVGSNNPNPPVTIQYSRIAGNSGGMANGTGLALGFPDQGDTDDENVTATNNWWGCNTDPHTTGTGCNTVHDYFASGGTITTTPFTTLTLTLSSITPAANTTFTATGSLGQNSSGLKYTPAAEDFSYDLTPATMNITEVSSQTVSGSTLSATANTAVSYAAITDSGTPNASGPGLASVTVDGCTVKNTSATPPCNNSNTTTNYTVMASDLVVTSAHTGNFKAGDTADTYTLTVTNMGNVSTSSTVVLYDMLPSGFTAVSYSVPNGSGWNCSISSSVTCTNSSTLNPNVTYPPVTLTVSVASTDVGTYPNNAMVAGGNEANTNNDTYIDSTIVVGAPTITQGFSPTTVAPNGTSTVTFTVGNPSANPVSLAGVAFTESFPAGLMISSAATTNCMNGTATGAFNATAISLSGATLAPNTMCTVTAGVYSPSINTYTITTGAVTATNSNNGGTATATLTVNVTPTRVAFIMPPAMTITAGGNAGQVAAELVDGSGNAATNNNTSTVTLTVTGPNGYSQTYGPTTVVNGVASFNLSSVPLTVAGGYTYTATSSGLTNAVAMETVNPGTAELLGVGYLTTYTAPGQSETATVKALDSYGNTVTSFTGTVTLSSIDPLATFSPGSYTYTASDAGVHTFTVSLGTAGTQNITATGGSLIGSQDLIQVEDAILVVNPGGSVSRLTDAGVATTGSSGFTGGGTPTIGAAIDALGDIFSLNKTGNVLVEFSKAGAVLSGSGYGGGGLSAPVALAVDGLGQVWVANVNGTVSEFSNVGFTLSPAAGFPVGGTSSTGIAIDTSGNVWTSNANNSTVTEILGGAAPVNPLAIAVQAVKLGARP